MSDVDTAAIRARYEQGGIWPEHVYALANALDAARAERERWEHDYWREMARAEAAKAERDEAIARSGAQWKRATDAEARIAYLEGYAAAAVKEHRDATDRINAALVQGHCVSCVHEALTGGTE